MSFRYYLQSGNTFLTINFKAFDFVILSDLNSNRNNFAKILFIRVTTKFLLFVFLFYSQYFCDCVYIHQFILRAYCHENISQSLT